MSDKKYNEQLNLSEQYKKEFDLDTDIVSSQTCKYLSVMQPSYILSEDSLWKLIRIARSNIVFQSKKLFSRKCRGDTFLFE